MRCLTSPDQDSVFGNTYCGVPNPNVPHRHPYPTRFHGAIFSNPQAFLPYRTDTWSSPPVHRAPPLAPWEVRRLQACNGIDDKLSPDQRTNLRVAVIGAMVGSFAGIVSAGPGRRGRGAALGAVAGAGGLLVFGALTA